MGDGSPQASFDVPYKPGPEDALKESSATTYQGEYEDPLPDTWVWDMIYAQGSFIGSAEITVDEFDVYSVCYELTQAQIDAGWGFCDAAVDIQADPDDFPKNGSPGKFEWKYEFDPVYPDMPPSDLCIELTGWTPPAGDFYIAIHASICLSEWTPDGNGGWDWDFSVEETGWGGVWDSKSLDGTEHWFGEWGKKWGGYAFTGDYSRYPIFDEFSKAFQPFHWGSTSYWNIVFGDNSPGSFFFDPPYHQANPWQGWCSDPRSLGSGANVTVDVYSSFDPDLPDYAKSGNWDLISFMVDQRRGPDAGSPFDGPNWGSNSVKQAFQDAVWYFKYGPEDPWWSTVDDDYWFVTITEGSLADSFIDYAIANGEGYFPRDGDWYAAVLFPVSGYAGQRLHTPPGFQTNIVEVDP